MLGLTLSADSEALTRLLQLTASVEHLREVSRLELRLRSSLLWQDLGQLLGVWAGLVTSVHFLVPAGGDHSHRPGGCWKSPPHSHRGPGFPSQGYFPELSAAELARERECRGSGCSRRPHAEPPGPARPDPVRS
ncbi:unnamed protein product [Rangifer tarandus platyrhynchus]|uniref:Uncharacterized protein n=2 Tax=Rangifer tarandus platyrhynchus TaxID=3082113 RepID=A0ABN8YFP1_RANTA|nr:unnamed protein product [Rangifer tarandus platyrhynchus]CAI9699604.1 unnamed protein product [Rangifer tarandus platyrhynchus]